ncbi:MAG: hypothetical protein ACFBSE_06350, partial [Prochloraceae cyanobacterium]
MVKLIEHIKIFGLEDLQTNYAININRHKKYPNLVCLKYSHRDSPFNEKIVCQARGIILDEAANWQIVSY